MIDLIQFHYKSFWTGIRTIHFVRMMQAIFGNVAGRSHIRTFSFICFDQRVVFAETRLLADMYLKTYVTEPCFNCKLIVI